VTKLRLVDFRRVAFFTGAGLSSESGIPTYRGSGGVWREYNYEEYACQEAFERDAEKVWDFHDKRREAVAAAEPNEGHRIIARHQAAHTETAIITQNIDGLHQRAGGVGVMELHGSLWRVRCEREGTVREDFSVPMSPRRCSCGAYLRPDITWFGDRLDEAVIGRAAPRLAACDLIVSIGTSGVVFPAADLPRIAVASGAVSVEINLEDTPVSHLYQHHLRASASEALAVLAGT
jgi:NAD-dependent deacetylase